MSVSTFVFAVFTAVASAATVLPGIEVFLSDIPRRCAASASR